MATKDVLQSRNKYSVSSSNQLVSSQAGPLQQLRIVSLASDARALEKNRHNDLTKDLVAKSRSIPKVIKSSKTASSAGFGFDLEFPITGGGFIKSDHPSHEDATLTDSSQMATIFLTSAKSLKSKFNVIDSIQPKDATSFTKLNERTQARLTPSARRRADIIKYTLEFKYTWIKKVADNFEDHGQVQSGIDKSYNPLQVIRNRVTRKRLHQTLPIPSQNPLPCDAFSSHRNKSRRPWKMLWGIELNELMADYAWRQVHWAELRDAKGNLWFPDAAASKTDGQNHRHASQRLHEKLCNDSDSDKYAGNLQFSGSVKESGAKGIRHNLKQKAKKLYAFQSSSAVDLRALNNHHHVTSKSLDGPALLKIAHIGESQSANEAEQHYQFKLGGSEEFRESSYPNALNTELLREDISQPPQIFIGNEDNPEQRFNSGNTDHTLPHGKAKDDNTVDLITAVNFSSAHSKPSSALHLDHNLVTSIPSSDITGNSYSLIPDDSQLLSLNNSLKLFNTTKLVSMNYLKYIYPTLLKSTDTRLDTLLHEEMPKLSLAINQGSAGLLPRKEDLYKGFIEEAKSITRLANDDCAVKIDNLLSTTDRTYGELNTSLIMELKKTNERLDILNQSLFSGVIGSASLLDDRSQNLEMSNHRLLYIVLENGIVIFLRLVWIGVTISKPFIMIARLLWRFFTLIFT